MRPVKYFAIVVFIIILGQYALPVYAQETKNVSISATVPAKPSDYQIDITADPRNSRQSQDATIQYTITYGSNLTYPTSPFVIEATLLPGRIQGSTNPSLYIADYVQGSASNAYMMTEPVINLTKHTITWTIPSLPAQVTDQTVSFAVKLNSAYTGSDVVDFDVGVKAIAPDITLNAIMSESYVYRQPVAKNTPTPTPQPLPQPTPQILNIQANEITNNAATFTIITSIPTLASAYAVSKDKKLQSSTSTYSLSRYHRMTISNLQPNISYDVTITAKNDQGQTVTSNTLQVHTTLAFTPIPLDLGSLIISSSNTIFYPESYASSSAALSIATLPTNTPYTFQIRVPDASKVSRIQGVMSPAFVLGAFWDGLFDTAQAKEPEAPTEIIDMTEISPSIYIGTLKTKPTSGEYELRIRMTDIFGNITEHLIGTMQVVQPFKVVQKQTNQPIENARIFLYRYIAKTGQYVPLSPSFTEVKNPLFTNQLGEAPFVLPQGTYKADVSYLGTKDTILFSIDNSKLSRFPVVYLAPTSLSIMGTITYILQTILDTIVSTVMNTATTIGSSQRLFEALSNTSLLLLLVVTFIAFSSRTLIPLSSLPRYLIHYLHSLTKFPGSAQYISGTVIDGSTRKPIALCDVSIIDASTNTIATIIKTDKSGHYFFRINPSKEYQIEIRKRGYERIEPVSFQPELSPYRLVHVLDIHHEHRVHDALSTILRALQSILSSCLELLIISTFILELLMIRYFGLAPTIPYVLCSLCTVVLWIAYIHHKKDLSTISQL